VFALAELPIRALLAAGVPVTLGSDDPLLFGAGVTDQYEIGRRLGLSDAELAVIAHHSISASAAPSELKRHLHHGTDSWLRQSS
jgi:adenosine deaminase